MSFFLPDDQNLRAIFKVTLLGTLVNFFLALLKISIGIKYCVNSVLADGIQSLTDLASDALLLVAVKFSYKPRSRARPFGNRKLETAMAFLISVILLSTAGALFSRALHPPVVETTTMLPALIASLIGVISKELLYRFTVGEGKRQKSPAVIANGWSHRADALSSRAIVVCILLGLLLGNFPLWDRLGVIVVCILILKAAWNIGRDAMVELLDYAPSESIMNQVEAIIDQDPSVSFVHQVRVRSVAGTLDISCTIEVDGRLSISDGAHIAERVEKELLENMEGVASVMIRVMPAGSFAASVLYKGLDNIAEEDLV